MIKHPPNSLQCKPWDSENLRYGFLYQSSRSIQIQKKTKQNINKNETAWRTVLATRAFCCLLPDHIPYLAVRGYLMVPNPRVIEYFDDIVFLFHPPHLLYHLPSRPYPSPVNSIIILAVVSVWIALFMWQVWLNQHVRVRSWLWHVWLLGMCDCSSLKSIMHTLDLILCFQCVIYTLGGIWGFMYGHVYKTGGIIEVLSSRPLKRFTFKDLLESQESQLNRRNETPTTNKIKGPRAALDGDQRGARLCCGLALQYVCVWRHISLATDPVSNSQLS